MKQPEEIEEVEEAEEVETVEETEEPTTFTPEQIKDYIRKVNGISNHIKHRTKKQTAARKKSKLSKASRKKNRKRK